MKKQISAQIVADSVGPKGNRITTFLLTYPRFIHGELMTHRVFSRNSASSRAIPFEKMVKMVEEDPFIPIAWQKDHKGMQGTKYFTGVDIETNNKVWLQARDNAIRDAILMNQNKVTKQLCNRLLEPFMWHTVLVTATEWDNFFELRCPKYPLGNIIYNSRLDCMVANQLNGTKFGESEEHLPEEMNQYSFIEWLQINKSQAEIHIQVLAEAMWDAMNESTSKKLQAGEWHIPFGNKINLTNQQKWDNSFGELIEADIKIATARCARLSYMTFDGEIDYEKDFKLHDQLLLDKHLSPFEHCARAMSDDEYYEFAKGRMLVKDGYGDGDPLEHDADNNTPGWCDNFRGFISYRYLTQNER